MEKEKKILCAWGRGGGGGGPPIKKWEEKIIIIKTSMQEVMRGVGSGGPEGPSWWPKATSRHYQGVP